MRCRQEGVVRCRAIWSRLAGRERCVVHGDPTAGNIRMTADRVALIDWDESRVDVPDLDLVLPYNAADLDDNTHDVAAQAWAAWDAALCFTAGITSSQPSGSRKSERSDPRERASNHHSRSAVRRHSRTLEHPRRRSPRSARTSESAQRLVARTPPEPSTHGRM